MKAKRKWLNSFFKKRKIELLEMCEELTGKYELPSKSTLAKRILKSEEGCLNIPFNSEDEFLILMIDTVILYGFTLEDLGKAIMAYNEYSTIELKGEKFIDIRFEENQFVLRFGFETDKKSAMKLQEFIKEKCIA
jgi:hypothetical protein